MTQAETDIFVETKDLFVVNAETERRKKEINQRLPNDVEFTGIIVADALDAAGLMMLIKKFLSSLSPPLLGGTFLKEVKKIKNFASKNYVN